ncbi:MAG: CocE/NonD family hydrolase [Streptosporangiales bacterium]|nr:CocE/NonD family hydrolase [Streptosporangiales bacterium]
MSATHAQRSKRGQSPIERDLQVSARDGTTLLVDHHWPRLRPDAAGAGTGAVVWIRTAYGRKGMATFAKRFAKLGAHVLVEAVRGTDGSGGVFDGIRLDPRDGADVAAWLRHQEWFPGRIVTWGTSYLGYASWSLAATAVPEWHAAVLHDTQAEARPVVFPGGVFNGVMLTLVQVIDWLDRHPNASMARFLLASIRGARKSDKVLQTAPLGTADERLVGHRADYFREWLDHENDDEYWQRLNLRPNAPRMPSQVHLATGWYDTGLPSTLLDYVALREAGKSARLVIGPWYHGQGFFNKAYAAEVDGVVAGAVRGETAIDRPSVCVHVGGADEWRELADWPPPGAQQAVWHLQPGGGLDRSPAPTSEPDRYQYDPANPTPAVGGAQENWTRNAGAKDNRKLESRDDVLTYSTDALTEDLEVIGPVTAEIVMRSSLEHTDLFARLCDVDPKGRSNNLCDGIRRLRPGDPTTAEDGTRRVTIDLLGTAHRFNAGHRIRLQVSSGAHPLRVRNLGAGAPLTTGTEMRTADQEIFHDPTHPSALTLPIYSPPSPVATP